MRSNWFARSGWSQITAIWIVLGVLAGLVVFVLFIRSLGGDSLKSW